MGASLLSVYLLLTPLFLLIMISLADQWPICVIIAASMSQSWPPQDTGWTPLEDRDWLCGGVLFLHAADSPSLGAQLFALPCGWGGSRPPAPAPFLSFLPPGRLHPSLCRQPPG